MAVILKKQPIANVGGGIPAPTAIWRVAGLYADMGNVRILFLAWASKELYEAGESPIPGMMKEYNLSAGTISAFPELETGIHIAAWAVAAQTLDTIDEEATALAIQANPEAAAVMKSFFKEATDV